MAWHQIGDKPLSEPMLTWITDAYMRHWGRWVNRYDLTEQISQHFHKLLKPVKYCIISIRSTLSDRSIPIYQYLSSFLLPSIISSSCNGHSITQQTISQYRHALQMSYCPVLLIGIIGNMVWLWNSRAFDYLFTAYIQHLKCSFV